MKYRFLLLINLFIIILLSGCSNLTSDTISENESIINTLVRENEQLITENKQLVMENKQLVNKINSLDTLILDHSNKNVLLQQGITTLEETKQSLSLNLNDTEQELSKSLKLMHELKKNYKNSIASSKDIVSIDELDIGSPLDKYRITNIESDDKHFSISLDGYFILEGYFMLNDGYGDGRFYFITTINPQNTFCNTRIQLNKDNIVDIRNPYMINNDEVAENLLGPELCSKMEKELKDNSTWMKIHATAVFSGYSSSAWWESEGMASANLVTILEIEDTAD